MPSEKVTGRRTRLIMTLNERIVTPTVRSSTDSAIYCNNDLLLFFFHVTFFAKSDTAGYSFQRHTVCGMWGLVIV